jgi:molybdopterin-containing oxidoreductase family membrane subunit
VQIIRIASVINLLMLFSELFTIFYAGGGHVASAKYLFLGDHGKHGLVPWIWSAIAFNVIGTILFFTPAAMQRGSIRIAACVLCVVGIWIEKGMGLIVPGFIPSTLHEVVEYSPSITEWKIAAGIWAFGLLILTVILKVAVAVFTNQMTSTATPTTEGSPVSATS